MSSSKIDHYFYDGRNGRKNGKTGPGILVVQGKYKFRVNQSNKDQTKYKMYCTQQGNPEFRCTAKATVIKRDDGSFYMYTCDTDHNHFGTEAWIIAENLKQRMEELVQKDPVAPVGDAIRAVKLEAAEEYAGNDDLFNEIVDSLGSFHSLELRLFRVRNGIIGPHPKSRDHFDPKQFLTRIYGNNHSVEILDSNKLPENWTELINKPNPNSKYDWGKLNDDLREHEKDEEVEEVDSDDIEPEEPPLSSQNLPKRVLAFTSKSLLQLFAKCNRGSLDGTFKSCTKLFKQQFIFMLKFRKHWIPVVYGWLPDKSEVSYKVFLYMILERLRELGISFNLKEIITDYELNIHKAIDELLPYVIILGCFFHLAKSFKNKVDKKHMKTHYEKNPKFRRFIKQAISLSSLPLDDLEVGLKWLKDNIEFEDEKEREIKEDFLKYIEDYWINGVYPPFIWSTWKRTDVYTNNNNEGYNSKMNRELKQSHPSAGILLSYIRRQILLNHHKIAEAKVAEKPRKLVKHKVMAQKRFDLKESYEKAKQMNNVNKSELIGEYLSIMGHNIISSTMIGRLTDLAESQGSNINDNDDNENENDTSSWQVLENSLMDDMFSCENPYV